MRESEKDFYVICNAIPSSNNPKSLIICLAWSYDAICPAVSNAALRVVTSTPIIFDFFCSY